MKKIVLLLFGLFYAFNLISAQHSGYMGKKFLIFANFSTGLPHFSVAASEKFRPVAHVHLGGSLEYILRKRIAFGIKYKYAMVSALNNTNAQDRTLFEALTYEKNKFRSHSISPYIKFYGKEAMAPLSMFIKLGLGFQVLQHKNFLIQTYQTYEYIDRQVFDTKINIGVGKNFILADLFLIGFEFETGIPLISHTRNALVGIVSNQYEPEVSIYKTNFGSEILKLSLNIGFLAF